MLTFFSVEGYKNFGERLSFDLADVRDYHFNEEAVRNSTIQCGLVYGKNASGKTNLGRAIMDVRDNLRSSDFVLRPLDDQTGANYLNADVGNSTAKFLYRFRIAGSDIEYEYEKTARFDLTRERLSVDGANVFDYDHDAGGMLNENMGDFGGKSLNWEFAGDVGSVLAYLCNNAVPSELGPLKDLYIFIREMGMLNSGASIHSPMSVRSIVSRVIQNDQVSELEEFLNRFGIDERLVTKETPDGDRALYFRHGRLIPFVSNCSSGTAALLRLFSLSRNKLQIPSLYFIDEFDAFYHYGLAEEVIGFFKTEVDSQVICTTHNTDLFSNKILRPDCLFILSKEGICSAANATKRELREGHNLEKLYKAGEFDV